MAVFSDEICDKIFTELANSDTGLDTICKKHNVAASTFRQFVLENVEISAKYAHARQMQIECIETKIQDASNEMLAALKDGSIEPQIASAYVSGMRIKIDSLKWILSKLVPKKYGDKLDVTSDNKPVNIAFAPGELNALGKQLNDEV